MNATMNDYVQVIVTTDSQTHAEQLANGLVDHRLAAGVQISAPIQSIYHWQGRKVDSTEWVCTIITRKEQYDALQRFILENHHYQVPQIIMVPIVAGSPEYLKWITHTTTP